MTGHMSQKDVNLLSALRARVEKGETLSTHENGELVGLKVLAARFEAENAQKPEGALQPGELPMTIKRITITQCDDGTWQFVGEHESGRGVYEGYVSAEEAMEAAANWAVCGEVFQQPADEVEDNFTLTKKLKTVVEWGRTLEARVLDVEQRLTKASL